MPVFDERIRDFCPICNEEIPVGEPLYMMNSGEMLVCQVCSVKYAPKCPHCGINLDKRPVRKANCPSCEKTMFVRSAAIYLLDTEIVTEQQAADVDRMGSALRRFPCRPIGHLYSTVAGVTKLNSDGLSRQRLLKKLRGLESLILEFEPDNKFDEFACAVKRLDERQLGYVHADLAATMRLLFNHGIRFTSNAVHLGRAFDEDPLGLWISIVYFSQELDSTAVALYCEREIRPVAQSDDPLSLMREHNDLFRD